MRRAFVYSIALLSMSVPALSNVVIYGGISQSQEWSEAPSGYRNKNLKKEIVAFTRPLSPGSILVKTSERKLYFVLDGGKAISFPVGVGREGYTWSGQNNISRKAEWPDWRPPPAMLKREAERGRVIPAFVKGGPSNPLGARALYIGDTEFRIHGTAQPGSVGRAASSGCIRMLNEHVVELYELVQIGARVVVE